VRFPRRRWVRVLAGAALALVILTGAANLYVVLAANGPVTSDIAKVPHTQVAIILGAGLEDDGSPNPMLADRIERGAELYEGGKVDKLLVSGDGDYNEFSEPGTMRDALLSDGIPGRDIFMDPYGVNTWASMVRARRIYGIKNAVIVTQGFHMQRSLYLADHAGLNPTGLLADRRGYGFLGVHSDLRELLARVKAIGTVVLNSGVTGGPEIPITGDGRRSWPAG